MKDANSALDGPFELVSRYLRAGAGPHELCAMMGRSITRGRIMRLRSGVSGEAAVSPHKRRRFRRAGSEERPRRASIVHPPRTRVAFLREYPAAVAAPSDAQAARETGLRASGLQRRAALGGGDERLSRRVGRARVRWVDGELMWVWGRPRQRLGLPIWETRMAA